MVTSSTMLSELIQMAKESTEDLLQNEEFIVRDLFHGFEWGRISRGNRTKLGSMYFVYAQSEGKNDIEILGKTPQNQQKYKKK